MPDPRREHPTETKPPHEQTAIRARPYARRAERTAAAPKLRLSPARLVIIGLVAASAGIFAVQRPLTAPLPENPTLADMTWVELRSAVKQGFTTVIVPSGGIEQNGAHMILGKHDRIVAFTAQRIAAEVGRALVAPVVSFVPEGDYDPPTGHMRFPGTIGVSESVYAGLLEGIARSLKSAGFTAICFIADHGGSQKAQAEVAARLNREWAGKGVRAIAVADYYFASGDLQTKLLQEQGETEATIGQHAGIMDTSELMAVHAAGVDLARLDNLPFTLEATGADGDPKRASAERGKALLELKIGAAVRQIRAALASPSG
jgi:creatinine amidohydrolase/Fe(II)-dependent formamide hydrolase-like protein